MIVDAGGAPSPLQDAALAAALFAIDPAGLGGVALRAPPGAPRDAWLAYARSMLPAAAPWRRLPPHVADDRLLGGLDLAATVEAGRPVVERGLIAEADGGVLLIAMAERLEAATAARLAAALDCGEIALERDGIARRLPARIAAIALDEGAAEDEVPPAVLLERLALRVDLGAVAAAHARFGGCDAAAAAAARARLPRVEAGEDVISALCAAAAALGVASLRAPWFALRAARAAAALAGRAAVAQQDAAAAARLVLAPRATALPPSEASAAPPPESDAGAAVAEREREAAAGERRLDDVVLAAAQAALPPALLAQISEAAAGGGVRPRLAGRAGARHRAGARGRPLAARPGLPRPGERVALVDTLRAAAPWQTLRRRERGPGARIAVRRADFRIRRYRQRTLTTTIFAVDASGSAALHRLAEAKGAVELLLADCYVRRDRVALVAFRGAGAETLLPPTRSLTRAKRSLAALPGGGGTPLAAGLEAAHALADAARRAGSTPLIVVLTDGRANVARAGGGRERAVEEARAAARQVREAGHRALLIDTAPRPGELARELAAHMGARYLPLPHADAPALSRAVRAGAPASRGAR